MPPKRQAKLPFGNSISNDTPQVDPDLSSQDTPSNSNPTTPAESSDANTFIPLQKKQSKKTQRNSWVYKWMRDGVDIQHVFLNAEGKEEWRCRFCTANYKISGGTGTISDHLKTHDITKDSAQDAKAKNVQIDIEKAIQSAAENPQKRRKLNSSDGGSLPLDGDVIEVLYVKFISACNMPLRLVECPEFRAFLHYLNEDIDRWLPSVHKTVRGWVLRQFKIEKDKIKLQLGNAKTKIHLSLDIWTSPSNKPILGVVAHYISNSGVLEHVVLAMKEIEGNHKGENLAPVLMEVIRDWEIAPKLGYIVMDNASNNDTIMQALSTELLHEYNITYDSIVQRLRCQGHIINLSVNSFIYVTDEENLEEDEEPGKLKQTLKEIDQWRKFGPIGKLHNIVVDIQSSAQKMQEFMALSKQNRPVRDNKTRWNSMARMIKKAITSPVYEAINSYVKRHQLEGVGADELSDEDWAVLRNIHDFLDQLAQTTLALESSVSTLDNVLPAMDFILEQFEQGKKQYKKDKKMASMYNSGWAKMEKYYKMTEESPAYIAALVLDPNSKWKYIEANWKKEWITQVRNIMDNLWNDYKPDPQASSTTSTLSTEDSGKNAFLQWKKRHQATPSSEDEYKRYCASECTYDVDPRSWWLEKTQQMSYPNLSRLALDILSIPAMSADPERLFSSAKLLISDLRNKLGMDIIEAFECLKSWYKIKGWEGEFKYLEEIIGAEVEQMGVDHVQTEETAV